MLSNAIYCRISSTLVRWGLEPFATLRVWIPLGTIVSIVLMGGCMPDGFKGAVSALNQWLFDRAGGFYLVFVLLVTLLFALLALSPMGKLKLGGEAAQPEHSFIAWFSMLFCAGMGTGFMFWGAAEPLYHSMNPPLILANTPALQQTWAMAYTFFHWGFEPWAVYGLTAVFIGFFAFNHHRGIHFSSCLGIKQSGLSQWIDGFTLTAMLFGVAATLGSGLLQLEGGIEYLLGWPALTGWPKFLLQLGLLGLMTLSYMLAACLGLDKGLKTVSLVSMSLCVLFMAVLFCLGPSQQIMVALCQGLGTYLEHFIPMSLGQGRFHDPHWVAAWTVKYWSWWIAWAPFIGLFIAMISKGRTLRSMVWGVMLAPSLFSFLWFALFGQTAIALQQTQHAFGNSLTFEQTSQVLFVLFHQLFSNPGVYAAISWFSLFLIAFFVIDSADSATYTLSVFSQNQQQQVSELQAHQEPPKSLNIVWGLVLSALAGVLVFSGGLQTLQEITLITVLPFTVLLCWAFVYLCIKLFRS